MTKENRLLGTAEKELSAGHSRKRRLTPDRPPRNLQSSKPKSDPFPGKVSLIRALVIAALAVTVPAVPAYAFTLQTSTETGTATETSSMEIQVLETITVARDSNIVMSLNDETNTINLYLNDQVTGRRSKGIPILRRLCLALQVSALQAARIRPLHSRRMAYRPRVQSPRETTFMWAKTNPSRF